MIAISESCTKSIIEDINKPKDLTFLKRLFKKMKDGSLRLTVIMFVCYTLGAGILTIPNTISNLGIVTGLIFLLVNFFLNKLSFYVFIILKKDSNQDDMVNILLYYLGIKFKRIFEIIIVFMFLNLEIIHLVMGWKFLRFLLINLFNWNLDNKKNDFIYRLYYCLCCIIIILPLIIKKKVVSLKYFTFLFLFFLFYCIMVFLIESPKYYIKFNNNGTYNFNLFKKFELKYFSYFSIFLFSFFSQPNMLNCWIQMKNPTKRRLKKTVDYGLLIELLIYLFFGIIGYITFGNQAGTLIILRAPLNNNDKDIVMKIGIFAYCLGLVISNSFHGTVLTNILQNIFWFKPKFINRLIFGMIPIIISLILTLLYPNILAYLSICGGIFCNLTGYILPFTIYYINFINKKSFTKYFMIILITLLIFLLIINIIIQFYN